jgi:outer membrane protein assembly factor BamB
LYTFGATGILNSLDAANGNVIWTRNAGKDAKREIPGWGFSSSPLVVDDVVIVAASGKLVAYDLANGNPRWFGPNSKGAYSSPQLVNLNGVPQVLFMSGTGTTGFNPTDGKVLWQYKIAGVPIVQPAIVPENGDVLITDSETGPKGLRRVAVEKAGGSWKTKEQWTSIGLKPYFNDFVVHNGHAYGFDGSYLSCIDLKDGERKWKGGKYGNGQLLLLADQDVMLILSEQGELALVSAKPDQFTELGRVPAISGKTWNHPALVRDTVFVRNGEEMAAFKLAATE